MPANSSSEISIDISPVVEKSLTAACCQQPSQSQLFAGRLPSTVVSIPQPRRRPVTDGRILQLAASFTAEDTKNIARRVASLLDSHAPVPESLKPGATLIAVGGVKVQLTDTIEGPKAPEPKPAPAGVPGVHPMAGLTSKEAITRIMAAVEADPVKDRSFFTHHIAEVGAEAMWNLAQEAAPKYGTEFTAQGGLRTKTSIFMKLCLKYKKQLRTTGAPPAAAASTSAAFVTFGASALGGAAAPPAPGGSTTPPAAPATGPVSELFPPGPPLVDLPLYPFQQRVLQRIQAAGPQQNWLVVAPTGTGKTRIFVEHFRQMCISNQQSRTVVVVPTVALTSQHATAFVAAGFPLPQVGEYHSDEPLHAYNWQDTMSRHSVIIATAQTFLNVLTILPAALSNLSLLVLDEAHHTQKDHPYNCIMAIWGQQKKQQQQHCPQVLGFTASPGAARTLTATEAVVSNLRATLHAKVEVVSEEEAQVQLVAPTPQEHEEHLQMREEDILLASSLWSFAQEGIDLLDAHLMRIPKMVDNSFAKDTMHKQDVQNQAGMLSNWLTNCIGGAKEAGAWDVLLACQLLKIVVRAYELVPEIGFEPVLDYLSRKLYQLLVSLRRNELGGGGAGADGSGSCEQNQPNKRSRLEVDSEDGDEEASSMDKYFAALADSRFRLPDRLATPLLDGLVKKLLTATAAGDAELLAKAFGLGPATVEPFPKLRMLVSFLQQHYSQTTNFHGIIFVRSRQGALLLADQLRQQQGLQLYDEVLAFTGHGVRKSKARHGVEGLLDVADAVKGLSGTQQRAVIAAFQKPGRRLLVATSAAEEGIDVQACELVVRYTAAASGIQRVQSRGRGRKAGGRFVSLILSGTQDRHLHFKSRTEERMMREYLSRLVADRA